MPGKGLAARRCETNYRAEAKLVYKDDQKLLEVATYLSNPYKTCSSIHECYTTELELLLNAM